MLALESRNGCDGNRTIYAWRERICDAYHPGNLVSPEPTEG
jgi:hypothetical protein